MPLQDGMQVCVCFGMPLILCSVPGHRSARRSLRRSLLCAHNLSARTSARSDAAHTGGCFLHWAGCSWVLLGLAQHPGPITAMITYLQTESLFIN